MARKAKEKYIQKEEIVRAYLAYNERFGEPETVSVFCNESKIAEEDFFGYFDNLKGMENAAWLLFLEDTLEVLKKDSAYSGFPVREKLLAFYFTHMEVLNQYRGYILKRRQSWMEAQPLCMKDYRHDFCGFVDDLIQEGILSGEIAERKFITEWYKEGFWLQLLFVIRFWCHDESDQFEKTDAAIEKAVNLSFELISRGPLEAMIDFAKFVIQNR
jgi:hypothetical protein